MSLLGFGTQSLSPYLRSFTYAEMQTLVSGNNLTPGIKYFISDRNIYVEADRGNELALAADFYDSTLQEIDYIEYDFTNDIILRRVDRRGNDVSASLTYIQSILGANPIDLFRWGDNLVRDNMLRNSVIDFTSAAANTTVSSCTLIGESRITLNSCGTGVFIRDLKLFDSEIFASNSQNLSIDNVFVNNSCTISCGASDGIDWDRCTIENNVVITLTGGSVGLIMTDLEIRNGSQLTYSGAGFTMFGGRYVDTFLNINAAFIGTIFDSNFVGSTLTINAGGTIFGITNLNATYSVVSLGGALGTVFFPGSVTNIHMYKSTFSFSGSTQGGAVQEIYGDQATVSITGGLSFLGQISLLTVKRGAFSVSVNSVVRSNIQIEDQNIQMVGTDPNNTVFHSTRHDSTYYKEVTLTTTVLDLTAADTEGVGIVGVTFAGSSASMDEINANAFTFKQALKIRPLPGKTLTVNGTGVGVALGGDIVMPTASLVLNGNNYDNIVVRTDASLPSPVWYQIDANNYI